MIVYIHLGCIAFALIFVLLADHLALSWFTGAHKTLSSKRINRYHSFVWLGVIGAMLTGMVMLLSRLYLLTEPLFIMKILFVGVLVVNAFLIGRLDPVATTRTYHSLTPEERLPLVMSGVISTFAWVATISLGFYLFGLPPLLS